MKPDCNLTVGNLYAGIPSQLPKELSQILWQTSRFQLERIVSRGHITPPGEWYDQDHDEWVVLLTGAASLRIEGRHDVLAMRPGDHVLLPAHLRHRVEWTEPERETIWLALFCQAVSG